SRLTGMEQTTTRCGETLYRRGKATINYGQAPYRHGARPYKRGAAVNNTTATINRPGESRCRSRTPDNIVRIARCTSGVGRTECDNRVIPVLQQLIYRSAFACPTIPAAASIVWRIPLRLSFKVASIFGWAIRFFIEPS